MNKQNQIIAAYGGNAKVIYSDSYQKATDIGHDLFFGTRCPSNPRSNKHEGSVSGVALSGRTYYVCRYCGLHAFRG